MRADKKVRGGTTKGGAQVVKNSLIKSKRTAKFGEENFKTRVFFEASTRGGSEEKLGKKKGARDPVREGNQRTGRGGRGRESFWKFKIAAWGGPDLVVAILKSQGGRRRHRSGQSSRKSLFSPG